MSEEGKIPPQTQEQQPGREAPMQPKPEETAPEYRGSGKLKDRIALITGGDSGIGRSVAVLFAREGADISIVYLNEHEDAAETKRLVEQEGRRCLTVAGDVGDDEFCDQAVKQTVDAFGRIDILVNNAAEQHPRKSIEEISTAQLHRTFHTNIYSMFYMTKSALKHMRKGSSIINTTSITTYRGSPDLLDYSSTKGAIVAFTRSLSGQLMEKGIRVNAVAPGPIWTPLIPSTFDEEKVESFGENVPMKRAGQPDEVAPSFVFLASEMDSSYISGQVLHPNGGYIVGS